MAACDPFVGEGGFEAQDVEISRRKCAGGRLCKGKVLDNRSGHPVALATKLHCMPPHYHQLNATIQNTVNSCSLVSL